MVSRADESESGHTAGSISAPPHPTRGEKNISAAAAAAKDNKSSDDNDDDDQSCLNLSSTTEATLVRATSQAESISNLARHPLELSESFKAPVARDQDDEADDDETKNLDSGYAWCILAVMFLIQSSISGSSRVYGIVYAKEVSIGYYDREEASWPIATASAIENLTSILTPALASYLSWRKIELLSTCLFISSNLLAYCSSSLSVDILALGLIQGLALATSTPLSLAINNDYFERYRTTAYGISMSGSTFGVLYLTPLIGWLLATYDDFRLVYLALAGVFSVNILLVLFIKPRAKTINKKNDKKAAAAQQRRQTEEVLEKSGANKSGSTLSCDAEANLGGQIANCLQTNKNSIPRSRLTNEPELRRKRSRLESHFERKESIASISHSVRSRRQSILSSRAVASNFDQQQLQPINGNADCLAGHKPRRVFSQRECILNHNQVNGGSGSGRSSNNKPPASAETDDHAKQHPALAKSFSIGANLFFKSQRAAGDQQANRTTNSICSSRNSIVGHEDEDPKSTLRDGNFFFSFDGSDGGAGDLAKHKTLGRQVSSHAIAAQLLKGHSVDGKELELRAEELNREISLALGQLNECSMARDNTKAAELAALEAQQQKDKEFSVEIFLKLIRLPYLHCVWIMLALYYLIARVFIIILVDFSDDHGFSLSESTSLLNYWSVGELLGRVFLGSLIDLNWMSCKSCITLTCLLLSGAIVLMVLVESYYVYAVCSLLIAALVSLEYMLINVLMVEYLGKKCVTSCYSLAACISSMVLFSRPSLIGLFRDHLGSYDGLLLLLAACSFAYAILFQLLEPLFVRKWPKLASI